MITYLKNQQFLKKYLMRKVIVSESVASRIFVVVGLNHVMGLFKMFLSLLMMRVIFKF